MKRHAWVALCLFISVVALGQQVFTGISGQAQTFQVLGTNNSDGGAAVQAAPCVCCEIPQLYSDGGVYCLSGTHALAAPDGGQTCGPMQNQKICLLTNSGPQACFLCPSQGSCRDQRDGWPILPIDAGQPPIQFNMTAGAAAWYVGCPGGNQVDGGGINVLIGR